MRLLIIVGLVAAFLGISLAFQLVKQGGKLNCSYYPNAPGFPYRCLPWPPIFVYTRPTELVTVVPKNLN